MFIRKDGTVFLFCSHKCQSNMLRLGRVPRRTPWTQAFRRAAGRVVAEEAVAEEAPAAGGALLAPLLTTYDPVAIAPPERLAMPSAAHLLGTGVCGVRSTAL